jgi:DNA-binding response OmpR family regulator
VVSLGGRFAWAWPLARWCGDCTCPEVIMKEASTLAPRTKVLVADDDEDMRALVASVLRADGYVVVEVCDGAELLSRLEEAIGDPDARPDVVVTDIMMPKLSGLGVLDALRRARVHFPVLLMTVLADDSVHIVARRLGALGVLCKPFDMDDLRTAVVNARLVFRRDHPTKGP